MYFTSLIPLLGLAAASPLLEMRATKPAAFFLAGDSTTASPSGSGGGWGDGFLATLVNGATGKNFGHNGATTVSFVSGGDWANVLAAVNDNKASYDCHVTIQFGHNDQKAASNITVDQYSTNLKNMANDVISAGGTPILVTPLSRRTFSSLTGKVNENLAVQAEATLSVASANGFDVIDLNKNSTAYLNAIGEANSQLYNRIETDTTHLNAAGVLLFGNMVSELILQIDGSLGEWLSPNATIVEDIEAGIFILPSTS